VTGNDKNPQFEEFVQHILVISNPLGSVRLALGTAEGVYGRSVCTITPRYHQYRSGDRIKDNKVYTLPCTPRQRLHSQSHIHGIYKQCLEIQPGFVRGTLPYPQLVMEELTNDDEGYTDRCERDT